MLKLSAKSTLQGRLSREGNHTELPRVAVCLTGQERSFGEVGDNIKEWLDHLVGQPQIMFGVKPSEEPWESIQGTFHFDVIEPQLACPGVVVPAWYTCNNYGRGNCKRNFVQELCDLEHYSAMIEAHEARTRRPFDLWLRMRADVFFESKLSLPRPLLNATVYTPQMESVLGVNDHVAFGDRTAMASYFKRIRYLSRPFNGAGFAVFSPALSTGEYKVKLSTRKHKVKRIATSEQLLQLALHWDGVSWRKLPEWMYCLHTKKAMLDQAWVGGCIARVRARTPCASLVCNIRPCWCICSSMTCEQLSTCTAPCMSSILGPYTQQRVKRVSVKGLMRKQCVDVVGKQLFHRQGCAWRRVDFVRDKTNLSYASPSE